MAKQVINIGTRPNSKDGDAIRDAFNKVNQNFTELYTALGLDIDTLNIGNFQFNGSTLSTIDNSDINISQSLVPTGNEEVDLGSPSQKWRSLYLSQSTLFLGSESISIVDGKLTISGVEVLTTDDLGNLTPTGDLRGSVYGNDSTLLVNAETSKIPWAVISDTPTIPTDISQLSDSQNLLASVNLDGYATETYVDNAVSNVSVDLTGYATETYVNNLDSLKSITLTNEVTELSSVTFVKPDNTTEIDVIDTGLSLTRLGGSGGGLINIAVESTYDALNSPINTRWNWDGWSNLNNVKERTYTNFRAALLNSVGDEIIDAELIMHDTVNDKYYKVKFTNWSQGPAHTGAITYTRTLLDTSSTIGIVFPDGRVQTEAAKKFTGFEQTYIGDISTYTLQLKDAGNLVYAFTSTIYVPDETSVNFPLGSIVTIVAGSDVVNISPVAGANQAVIHRDGSATQLSSWAISPYTSATLIKIEPNIWHLTPTVPADISDLTDSELTFDPSTRRMVLGGSTLGIVETLQVVGHAGGVLYLSSATEGTESTHIALSSTSGISTTMYGNVSFGSGSSVNFTNATVSGLSVSAQGFTYNETEGTSEIGVTADVFDFGDGKTIDMQNSTVLFTGSTISGILSLNADYITIGVGGSINMQGSDIGAAGSISAVNVSTLDLTTNTVRSEGDINISVNLTDSTTRNWTFTEGGQFETAGSVIVNGGVQFPGVGTISGDDVVPSLDLEVVDGGDIALLSGNYAWKFGGDGTLTVPGNGKIASPDTGNLEFDVGRDNGGAFIVTAWADKNDPEGGWKQILWGYDGSNYEFFVGGDVAAQGNVKGQEIKVGPAGTAAPVLSTTVSEQNGLAMDLRIDAGTNGGFTGNVTISGDTVNLQGTVDLSNASIVGDIRSENNINIDINLSDSTLRRWRFGEDGNLTIPGNIESNGSIQLVSNASTVQMRGTNAFGSITYDDSDGDILIATTGTITMMGAAGSAVNIGGGTSGNITLGNGSNQTIINGNLTFNGARTISPVATTTFTSSDITIQGGTSTDLSASGGDVFIEGGLGVGGGDNGTVRIDQNAAGGVWIGKADGTGDDIQTYSRLRIHRGVTEDYVAKADATGVVEHDCDGGHLFYHTIPLANWTVNLTNLNAYSGMSTNIVIVIEQGGTPYYPSALQIGGAAQTIKWLGNVTPTPQGNKTEIATFTIFYNGSAYNVLGSYSSYG